MSFSGGTKDINHTNAKCAVKVFHKMVIFRSTCVSTRAKSHTAVTSAVENLRLRRNLNCTSSVTRARDRGNANFAPKRSCTKTRGSATCDVIREKNHSNVTIAVGDSQSNGLWKNTRDYTQVFIFSVFLQILIHLYNQLGRFIFKKLSLFCRRKTVLLRCVWQGFCRLFELDQTQKGNLINLIVKYKQTKLWK